MENTELKKKLEETKSKIKANSKDAHFADALISDLLSIKGQMAHEPTVVHYELKDVEDTVSGNTFEISIMKDGTAIYHVYGGYTIIADTRIKSLNMTIKMIYECMKNGGDDETMALSDAVCHVLALPMVAFSDAALTYKLATMMLEWLSGLQDELSSAELQEEDPSAMPELKESMDLRKTIKDALS